MAKQIPANGQFIDIQSILAEIGSRATDGVAKNMVAWSKALEKNTRNKSDIKKINKDTAQDARQAVMQAYTNSGLGKRPSYRQNDPGKLRRYAGGKMDRAISDPKLIVGNDQGIFFVNKALMDKHARQWYRLNFGALPKKSKSPNVGSMTFYGRASKSRATLAKYGPSQPFLVPQSAAPAFWSSTFVANSSASNSRSASHGKKFNSNSVIGKGALYIRRRGMTFSHSVKFFKGSENSEAGGIEGKRFLDAGARAINLSYPKRITKTFDKWEKSARKSMK